LSCCRCNSVRRDLSVVIDPAIDAFAEHLNWTAPLSQKTTGIRAQSASECVST
jgi:hypothetical protein